MREIPRSENECIPGSKLSATAPQFIPRQTRREEGQVADTAQWVTLDSRPSAEEEQVERRSFWCEKAMGTMTMIGRTNPHQERCRLSTIRYINCQHEGYMAYVHQFCQHDWLERHRYAVPNNLPIFCQNHTENYMRWVRFTAGDIPQEQNGCKPGSVSTSSERRYV